MKLKQLLPIIGVIILIFIISTLDLQEIYNVFTNINPIYSIICFFSVVPILILSVIQWQILLKKQKIKVSYLYSLKNIFIGYFYGFISPGGFGAYTRAFYLEHASKSPLPKCFSNIIIHNTIDYLSLLLLGAIGALFLSSIYPYLFVIIILVMILVIGTLLFFLRKDKSKILFTKIIQTRIFATIKDRLSNSIDSLYEDIPSFKDVILPFFLSLSGWILRFTEFFLISRLFGFEIDFIYFILIVAVANVIASIPISIYGLGTREVSLITMFSVFGVMPERVLSLSLFWFVVIWLTPSIIGAIITSSETKKFSKFVLNERTIERFSNYMKKFPELYSYLASIIKKNLPKSVKNPCIVDLGIGPGLLSNEIHKQIPKANIIGIEPSKKMIKKANENIEFDGYKAIQGSAENIPLEDEFADIIVTRFTLAYWKKPREGFNEIHRVLKPGGKIVIEALNRDFSKLKLFFIKTHMIVNMAGSDVIRYHVEAYGSAYSIISVKQLLKDADFEITYLEGSKKDWKFIVVAKKK